MNINTICPACHKDVFPILNRRDDMTVCVRCAQCNFKSKYTIESNDAIKEWNQLVRPPKPEVKTAPVDKKFWLVWTPGFGANNPRHRHESLASAKAEAERLARLSPGQEFYAVEIMGKAVVQSDIWVDILPVNKVIYDKDGVPF